MNLQKRIPRCARGRIVVTKNPEGKIKLHQPVNLAVICSFRGRFWGLLIGMIFMMPAFGLAYWCGRWSDHRRPV